MLKQRNEVVLNTIGRVLDKLAKQLPYIPMDIQGLYGNLGKYEKHV